MIGLRALWKKFWEWRLQTNEEVFRQEVADIDASLLVIAKKIAAATPLFSREVNHDSR